MKKTNKKGNEAQRKRKPYYKSLDMDFGNMNNRYTMRTPISPENNNNMCIVYYVVYRYTIYTKR